MKVYVVTLPTDWNMDYLEVFADIDSLVDGLYDNLIEDGIWLDKKDIKKHIKKREKDGAVYLFFADEIDKALLDNPRAEYIVRKTYMKNPKPKEKKER